MSEHPPGRKVRINVTDRDIDNGTSQNERHCPIARAMNRHLGRNWRATVNIGFENELEVGFLHGRRLGSDSAVRKYPHGVADEGAIVEWIETFDFWSDEQDWKSCDSKERGLNRPEPVQFEMSIPEMVIRRKGGSK